MIPSTGGFRQAVNNLQRLILEYCHFFVVYLGHPNTISLNDFTELHEITIVSFSTCATRSVFFLVWVSDISTVLPRQQGP